MRQTFWPCRATIVDGGYELKPMALASSGDSSGLAGANALLAMPTPPQKLDLNQPVEFIPCP
jgi:molybdopterin molybdotransferase